MTNEQAIIELRDLISDDRTDRENEALLLAIKALKFIDENFPNTFIDYLNGVQIYE